MLATAPMLILQDLDEKKQRKRQKRKQTGSERRQFVE
jgi:hypothetical protein